VLLILFELVAASTDFECFDFGGSGAARAPPNFGIHRLCYLYTLILFELVAAYIVIVGYMCERLIEPSSSDLKCFDFGGSGAARAPPNIGIHRLGYLYTLILFELVAASSQIDSCFTILWMVVHGRS
jgi:hypothetical protein